jgi:hypothetical protein
VQKDNGKGTIFGKETGGWLSGSLFATKTFLRSPQAKTFQEVWTVALAGTLEYGGCGTWVFDIETGGLYGYIISGSPEAGMAYVIPAEQIYYDISQRLGTEDIQLFMGPQPRFTLKNQLIEKPIHEVVREALQLQETYMLNEVIVGDKARLKAANQMLWNELQMSQASSSSQSADFENSPIRE